MKREGEALTSPGNPLANLTTVTLSRIRSPETSSRTCVESMLCKVHPELYIPSLTQPIMNAPDLYHFSRLGVLCWFEAEQPGIYFCCLIRVVWSDGGSGLMVWFGGRIWRWSGVEFGCGDLICGWWTDGLTWGRVWRTGLMVQSVYRSACGRRSCLSESRWSDLKSEKKKSWGEKWNCSIISSSGKPHKYKRRKKRNTFMGTVATLKRTATTKPNYISNYRILLRIFLIFSIWLSAVSV